MKCIQPNEHLVGRILMRALDGIKELPYVPDMPFWDSWTSITPPPNADITRPIDVCAGRLDLNLQAPPDCHPGCGNYFPPQGGMGWHTDSHRPGWRLYVYKLISATSTFYYKDWMFREIPGWGGYVFETGAGCWHAVRTSGPRLSAGFRISVDVAQQLIGG